MTARLSRSNFTYSFPVTPERKFICLYFYPDWYPDFNRSLAFFTVQIGPYSLLKNFSAALTADSMLLKSFIREFCVTANDCSQKLHITFSPSSPDAYAFINGIEIVSMPTNLYGSTPHRLIIRFVGYDRLFYVDNNSALETVYRLDIGGGGVSPMRDTGMFRWWDDDQRGRFLSRRGEVVPENTAVTINYIDATPPYTTPKEIYRTARTMGTNSSENLMYNLTWRLLVDSGFNYLIRLHFCEFQFAIKNIRAQQMFKIYINSQTTEEKFDVIWFSGGKGIPIFKDYIVMMEKVGVEDESKRDIFIALHPNYNFAGGRREQVEVLSNWPYAILNGLEQTLRLARI